MRQKPANGSADTWLCMSLTGFAAGVKIIRGYGNIATHQP
jgi:hypothetical protein